MQILLFDNMHSPIYQSNIVQELVGHVSCYNNFGSSDICAWDLIKLKGNQFVKGGSNTYKP